MPPATGARACFGWPAACVAGQFEIAAVMPRRTGAARAAPGWPPSARVSGRPRLTARPPQGSGDRRGLACAGALLWPAEVDGAPSAGVRDHRSPARAGAPLWPAEVDGAPAAGVARRGRAPARGSTLLCPAEKGGEMKNGACHLSRNNA